MNLKLKTKDFELVSKVKIPDVFFRRFKTGIESLDKLLGSGILPGSTFTITAPPGCGKTTLMLQTLDSLVKGQKKKVAFASGEEDVAQLAYNCKRLGVTEVYIANKMNIDALARDITKRKLDILIMDSFQCLRTQKTQKVRQVEQHVVDTLLPLAKKEECTLGFIMHITKQGIIKGGSLIPHAVDMNMEMITGFEDERILTVSKNRFGSVGEETLYMGPTGFDFTKTKKAHDATPSFIAAGGRVLNNGKQFNTQLLLDKAKEGDLNLGVATELTGNYYRGRNLINELCSLGKLRKVGRGIEATWVLTE